MLGVVRLGLDADWDRLEHIANYDSLVRQMLGVPATPWGEEAKVFGHQTLRDNVALLDDELLRQINARIAAAGREVFAKKGGAPLAALEVKVDTYVLETDVHFPTDLNLLWDAGRKCVDLIVKYRDQLGYALPGWRKAKEWRRQLKRCERITSQIVYRGGPNKEARVKRAVRDYLAVGRELSAKVHASLLDLCDQPVDTAHWEALEYFHRMLDKHLDLVQRRLLQEETIPAHEKVFSLFEPHTEWIQKGKQRPNVELGHRLLIATDQHQLIQDYDVPVGEADVDQSIPVADRLLGRYGAGSLASLSFDKGFTRSGRPGIVEPVCAHGGDAQTRKEERGGAGTREREEVCGAAPTTQRGGERDQQPGTSRTEPMPGRGAAGLFAVCGLRGDELQPARDRAGVAGAGMGAGQAGALGGLNAAKLETASQVRQGRCRYRRRILTVWAWPRAKISRSPPHCRPQRLAPLPKSGVSGQILYRNRMGIQGE